MTNLQPRPDAADLTLSEDDRRELIDWAARCVRRLMPVFAEHRPLDDRLRRALDAVDEFRDGRLAVGPMRAHALSCHAAARECEDDAAQAVARACGQAIAVAHMGGHARNVERYTRKALSGPPSSPNLNGSAPQFRRGRASTSSATLLEPWFLSCGF